MMKVRLDRCPPIWENSAGVNGVAYLKVRDPATVSREDLWPHWDGATESWSILCQRGLS